MAGWLDPPHERVRLSAEERRELARLERAFQEGPRSQVDAVPEAEEPAGPPPTARPRRRRFGWFGRDRRRRPR